MPVEAIPTFLYLPYKWPRTKIAGGSGGRGDGVCPLHKSMTEAFWRAHAGKNVSFFLYSIMMLRRITL